MGLKLGIDGKRRAVNANKGNAVSALSNLYIGLLQTAPANMDGMDLATLTHPSNGSEFSINADFYDSRKVITLGAVMADEAGATVPNDNVTPIEWLNNTGSTVEVAALFITDAASGTVGEVIWVGTPDAGTATIAQGTKASINANDLTLRVD